MFRVDSFDVIDATECGDAARFINHSCEVFHLYLRFSFTKMVQCICRKCIKGSTHCLDDKS